MGTTEAGNRWQERPSLQLTEDHSEPARGRGHLSRSRRPLPPQRLGPLLPAPHSLGPAPALLPPDSVWLPY